MPPPKPWERVESSAGPSPFKPPAPGRTTDVVEASGTAKPGEIAPVAERNTVVNGNPAGRPQPVRPWEQDRNNYGYGANMNYNPGYGGGTYSQLGGYGGYGGGGYGGGMYNTYRGGYGSGMYGGGMYNNGYGGQMGGYGGQMGGYGMGMGGYGMGMGGPYGNHDPNDPNGGPASPPSFWISVLRAMHGVVDFFGRIALLIDQNTHAFHMFMSALLQLFDRSGVLYGELARFVLRLLGIKTKPRKSIQPGPQGALPGLNAHGNNSTEAPKSNYKALEAVWENENK